MPIVTSPDFRRAQASNDGPHREGVAAESDIDTRKLFLTIFKDATANNKFKGEHTLVVWRDLILASDADAKEKLFWLKGASFGDTRSKRNSFRTNLNVQLLTAIVVEYDAGEISFLESVATITKVGLRALAYTSPSHRNDKPKWRVILPLSDRAVKTQHELLVAMVNGLFGGKLAPESFTRSQSYYFGSVAHNPDHQAVVVDGQFLDLKMDTLYRNSISKDGSRVGDNSPQQLARRQSNNDREIFDRNVFSTFRAGEPADEAEVEFALNQISPDCPYRQKDNDSPSWMGIGAALASGVDYDDGLGDVSDMVGKVEQVHLR
jgi:hypothetical protein